MRLLISGDYEAETGLDDVVAELTRLSRTSFDEPCFGPGVADLEIKLVCRREEPTQRTRYERAARRFTMDTLLPFNAIVDAAPEQRRKLVARQLCDDVQETLGRRHEPIQNFDYLGLSQHLEKLFQRAAWW
jgi:hypothetical protein